MSHYTARKRASILASIALIAIVCTLIIMRAGDPTPTAFNENPVPHADTSEEPSQTAIGPNPSSARQTTLERNADGEVENPVLTSREALPTRGATVIASTGGAAATVSAAEKPANAEAAERSIAASPVASLPPLGRVDLRDKSSRAALVAKWRAAENQHQAEVAAKAAKLGLPLELLREGQRRGRLVGFEGDRPVYEIDYNANAAISSGANHVRNTVPFNVSGAGLKFGLWEASGIPRATHQEFGTAGKITVLDGRTTLSDHASHVACTLAGIGVNAAALGMAPGAEIWAHDASNDNSEMLAIGAAYPGEPGTVYVSNHSYGLIRGWESNIWYGTFIDDGDPSNDVDQRNGRYDGTAAAMDDLLYNLPYFLPFMSPGNDRNDGPPAAGASWQLVSNPATYTYDPAHHPAGDGQYKDGFDLIDPEKTAKNVMTVGAAEDAVINGSRDAAAGVLTSFSSTGPADDGRIKPDVVANGASLTSAISTSDNAYASMSGTSMSSPNAAGSAMLLIDYFGKRFPGQAMRASTLKALIIHTADDAGVPGPDYQYGWGYINAERAAQVIQQHADGGSNPFMIEGSLTTADGSDTHAFNWNGAEPIRVTLVWTDPAGTGTNVHDDRTPKLINDLNLKVTGPDGSTHFPFVMPYVGDWSNAALSAPATTGINTVDNVEQVFVSSPPQAGLYTITVDHAGSLAYGVQDYSLIVTGGGTPDSLAITPFDGLSVSGDAGGPFTPTSKAYTLENTSSAAMNWAASLNVPWATISPASGTLAPGASAELTVTLAAAADALPVGFHQGTIAISNQSTGTTQTRAAVLQAAGHAVIAVEEPEGHALQSGPGLVDFGSVPVGAQSLKRVAIRNEGNAPLLLSAPQLNGADDAHFSLGPLSAATVPPGGSAYLDVTFYPKTPDGKSIQLLIGSNDENTPQFAVNIQGNGGLLGGGVSLTRTINNTLAGIGATNLVAMDGYVAFSGQTQASGRELWRTDGSAGGTYMISDIFGGISSSSPGNMIRVGSKLFFTATTSSFGTELWSSDGTSAGTAMIKDIRSGLSTSSPGSLTNWDGTVFFAANDGVAGTELWKSDGTASGTVMVADIAPGAGGSTPTLMKPNGAVMFFVANSGTSGLELWKTDGTAGGTVMVKDINPGASSSTISNLTIVGSTLFFTANDGVNGTELWKSDGTTAGTSMVLDINPGATSSSPISLVEYNGQLFFRATTAAGGSELWRSDGTSAGTVQVKDLIPGAASGVASTGIYVYGGYLWFSGSDGTTGTELWRSDGTEAGTQMFVELYAGPSSSTPSSLLVLDGGFYFSALNSAGRELWWSDGTTAGTKQVKDIYPGAFSSLPANFTDLNGVLIFTANDGLIGTELWRSDGTAPGTVPVLDAVPGVPYATVVNLSEVNGRLYFGASDGLTGTELWTSDGTIAGTVQVKDILAGISSSTPAGITAVPGGFVFAATGNSSQGNELWFSDGTAAGTTLVKDIYPGTTSSLPSIRVRSGSSVYFAATDPTNGQELWRTDGTSAGTTLVKDILSGTGSSSLASFADLNGIVLMSASNGASGAEPWVSDGTAAGTALLADIYAGSSNSFPTFSAGGLLNGKHYFSATNLPNGRELWVTDGTAAGTSMVADIYSGASSSSPNWFIKLGDQLYFAATSSTAGNELWRTDGTTTELVVDINPGAGSSSPNNLAVLGNALIFAATTGANGTELWRTDGTPAGTYLLKDINPGTGSSSPTFLTNVNGTVFFRATTAANGLELWKTDGTASGTELVADLMPGSSSSTPSSLTRVGPKLFFLATIPEYGSQLMVVDNSLPAELAIELPAGIDLTSGSAAAFGTVDVGDQNVVTFTVRNLGDLPLELGVPEITGAAEGFHIAGLEGVTVDGLSSTTFSVAFKPLRNGAQNATLSIPSNDSDESPFVIQLSGTGTNQPAVGLDSPPGSALPPSGAALEFGPIPLGSTAASRTISVRNLNPGTQLHIVGASLQGPDAADFSLDASALVKVLAGGSSSSFSIGFSPLGVGTRSATLTVQTNDPDLNFFTITLSATGVAQPGPTQSILGPPQMPLHFATDGPFVLPYVASSGLPLTVEVLAGGDAVSVTGTTVIPGGSGGAVTLRLSQAGGSGYDPAAPSVLTFLVAAGKFTSLAIGAMAEHGGGIQEDGSLWMWGRNTSGQLGVGNTVSSNLPQRVGAATDWHKVAVGSLFTLALKKNGTLWAWGNNSSGQLGIGSTSSSFVPVQVGTATNWVQIAAGGSHALGLQADGSLWVWGSNNFGQLGLGDTTTRTAPIRGGVGASWKGIAAGSLHSAALKSDGTLWAWGNNSSYQLAQGDTTTRYTLTQIGTTTDWTEVYAGAFITFARKPDGTLWGAGMNSSGQLGNNGTSNATTLVAAAGGIADWTLFRPGNSHTAGIRADGSLWIWGSAGDAGRTALGSSAARTTPTRVGTDTGWVDASVGYDHTIALKSEGTIWSAGGNLYGQLGAPSPNPTVMATGGIRAVGEGLWHTHFIRSDGTLWGVGLNLNALGDGTSTPRPQPVQIGSGTDWDAVTDGNVHSIALRGGTLWSEGGNTYGQVGDGTTITHNTYSQIGSDNDWTAVAAGSYFSAALKADGTLWTWGQNSNGQLGLGDTTNRSLPTQVGTDNDWAAVSCGYFFMTAVKSNGTLWAWGHNTNGQLGQGNTTQRTVPTQIGTDTDWKAVSAGGFHTTAQKTSGALWACGHNSFGSIGDGTNFQRTSLVPVGTDTDWVKFSACSYHTLALKANGELWSWGYNLANQTGSGEIGNRSSPGRIGNSNAWKVIPSGRGNFTVAATEDGTLWGFGVNGDAQLTDNARRSSLLAYAYPSIGTQTVSVPPVSVPSYDTPVSIKGTASSGLPVSYSVSGPATVSGNQLTVTGPGEVKLLAWQAGDGAVWHNAPFVQIEVIVPPLADTLAASEIDFTSATVHGTAFAGGQNSSVSFEYDTDITDGVYALSTGAAPTTVNGSDFTPVTATLSGLSPGTTYHFRTKVVNALGTAYGEDMTFITLTPEIGVFDGTSAGTELQDGAGSIAFGTLTVGDTVTRTFTIVNSGTGALSISSVTASGDWTVILTGMSPTLAPGGNTGFTATFAPSGSGPRSGAIHITSNDEDEPVFDVAVAGYGLLPQAITFDPVAQQSCGTPLLLGATASSGLAVTYQITTGAAFASMAGNTVTFSGTGMVTIEASQAGDATYASATPVSRSFAVIKGDQMVSFDNGIPASSSYRSTVNLAAASSRGLTPVVFQVLTGAGSITGSTLSFSAPGPVQIQASQAGDDCFNPASSSITIAATNAAPVASNGNAAGDEDTTLAGTLSANDIDPETTLTFSKDGDAAHGTVIVNGNGSFSYVPDLNYNGTDSFTFKVNDGLADSNVATISITVNAVNDAPVADAQSVSTPDSIAKAITLTGSDVDMDPLTFEVVTPPAHGTLSGTAPALSYLSESGYAGPDSFTFKVNDGTVDSAESTVMIDVTPVAPVITTPPAGQTINPGTPVTLNVANTGSRPLTYQWRKNGTDIPGAGFSSLVFASVQEADEGSYDVVITNTAGTATSDPAVLSVNDPVVIDPQQAVLSISETDPVTFSVNLSGTGPMTYQWRKDGSDIPGATASSYSIAAAALGDAGVYDVMVTNIVGPVASSGTQLRVIGGTPEITAQPQHQLSLIGGDITFTVSALGTPPLAYQWKRNGINIRGANQPALTLSSVQLAQAGKYTVAVTSVNQVLSDVAELGVAEDSRKSLIKIIGSTAALSLKTAGNGLSHGWKKDTGALPGDPRLIVATSGRTLTIKKLTVEDSATYACEVSGPGGMIIAGTHQLKVFNQAPDITPLDSGDSLPPAIVSGVYSFQIPIDPSPDRTPTSFAATGLPSGLKLNTSTGIISGRPTVSKSTPYAVRLTASNTRGKDTIAVNLSVVALPSGAIGTFAGPLARNAGLNAGLGGRIDFTTTTTGAISGKLTLGTSTHSFRGVLDTTVQPDGPPEATIIVNRPGTLSPLTLNFTLDPDNNRISKGGLTDASDSISVPGWRKIWNSRTIPADAFDGLYTFALEIPVSSAEDTSIPQGTGFGSFKVDAAGNLRLAGKTADGESITGTAFVGPEGEIVVFQKLYSTSQKGSLAGTLLIDPSTDPDDDSDNGMGGTISWSRPPSTAVTARSFKAGFGPVDLTAIGGRFQPPAAGQILLGLTGGADNAALEFAEGGIDDAATSPNVVFEITHTNKVVLPAAGSAANPARVSLFLTAATGAFRGSFSLVDANPLGGADVKRTVSYQGVLLPAQAGNRGGGYFMLQQLPANPGDRPTNTPVLSGRTTLRTN